MPDVNASRVKTSGTGEIDYTNNEQTGVDPALNETPLVETSSGDSVSSVTGENIGVGHGLFAGSNGADDVVLEFRSLQAGNGIQLVNDGTTIRINATGGGTGGGDGNGVSFGDGFDLSLGDIVTKGDGSWSPGAIAFDNATKVSEAMDRLNEVLGMLLPASPPAFPNGVLTVANQAGSQPKLAQNFNNNASGSQTAGTSVTRIIASGLITSVLQDVGPGEAGTLNLLINGNPAGAHNLTGTGDGGNYGGLKIADQKDFPVSTPGFWKSIDVSAETGMVPLGLNKVRITHSGAGQTDELFFVRDDMIALPTVSAVTVAQSDPGVPSYSSGIPHYGNGARLSVTALVTNLAGQTYYGGTDPFTVTNGGGAALLAQNYDYAGVGLITPLAKNTLTATTFGPVTADVNANVHGFGWIRAEAKNVNGLGGASETGGQTPTTSYAPFNITNTKILVKRGAATGKIDEMSVPVTGLGSLPNTANAVRVNLVNGDKPAGTPTPWVQTVNPAVHEAVVAAGVLMHDKTDYSKTFLPVGPNLSVGRDGTQYVTFSFDRASVSTFKINVTGSYAGCWVKLPGVSDNATISPNATNGWWDASKAYDGAGVPGEAGDTTSGCAAGAVMGGGSGSFTITFGPQSSTNATNNRILVRIRLEPGQVITALSFSN